MIINITGLCESSLIGKIKTITESINSEISFSRSFDENGYETERRFYKNAEVERVFKMFPDAQGWRVDEFYLSSNSPPETICKFNKNRKLIYHYGKEIDYNDNGKIFKETRYYKSGILEEEITYQHNEFSTEIQSHYYGNNGSLNYVEKVIEKHNDKNRIEAIEKYNSDGVLEEETIYSYDANGRLIEDTRFEHGVIIEEFFYNYNNNGHCIYERHIDEKHGYVSEFFFKHELDELDRIHIKKEIDNRGKTTKQTIYEFDQVGNTIKEHEINITGSLKSDRSDLRTFKIEYY